MSRAGLKFPRRVLCHGNHYRHHPMPRRVQSSDSEEEGTQRTPALRKSRRAINGSQNSRNPTQVDNASDSEEEAEESPKGRKRARANTGGDSHQVKGETDGSSHPGTLVRDADG